MNEIPPKPSSPANDHLSRSRVGRLTGIAARLFASTTTLRNTRRYLRRQLWAWPIIAAILFGGAGWWVHQSVEAAMRAQRIAELNVLVDASATALRTWMEEQKINAQLIAEDEQLRPLVDELLAITNGIEFTERQLVQSPTQELLRQRLKARISRCGYVGYFVVAANGLVIAADQDPPIGKALDGYRREFFDRVVTGQAAISKPFRSPLMLADEHGYLRANLPCIYAAAPLLTESGSPIAALGLRIRPEDQFTRIIEVVRYGKSGESYAFDRNGLLLSQSRFDDSLKQIGLLVDQPEAKSILTVELRDPQVNMLQGERPALRRTDQPLTRLAASAVQGKDGFDADGYRGYRGVPKVGAWRWLVDFEMGIGTEADLAEAFQPVYILRRAFRVLMGLLLLSAVGIFLAMQFIARQQKALQQVTLAVKQLGQYALGEKIGAGGMGTVYKARHAMLRRPTAVKLLNAEQMSDTAVTRFEREVQLTSSLTHPNTVVVFDYGRTPDGVFYYAMEYLDGLNLDELVKRFGPLTDARVVYILKQACGALAEAHAAGLIHRDIKPANIFLTCRGGLHDFVKVLDFGLVKTLMDTDEAQITNPNAVNGTPLYISPEAVAHPDQVDARSDVYALAAVGYYLLTGTPVFNGVSVMEICMKHVRNVPTPPSIRKGQPVAAELEQLLLQCLAKSRDDRPTDAAELLRKLEACSTGHVWSAADATTWWLDHADTDHDQPDASATTQFVNG